MKLRLVVLCAVLALPAAAQAQAPAYPRHIPAPGGVAVTGLLAPNGGVEIQMIAYVPQGRR